MGLGYISGTGGGGVTSDDVTATRADVLPGKTTVTRDSADEVVEGTMPNNGAVSQTIGINGRYTIPAGYHNGQGEVSQNIPTKGAATYYPGTSEQTIGSGQYLSGEQKIGAVSQENLIGDNIKPGVTIRIKNAIGNIFSVVSTMASEAAATYYATTSDQTIPAGRYLTGDQTIKKLTQSGLSAANIVKGKNVTVNNGRENVWSVTGTAQEFAHASGNVTSGSSYQDGESYTYPVVINLPFIPETGYVITYKNGNRDITIIDPDFGNGKVYRMVNFNQARLHGLNSVGYNEGEYNYTCTKARVVLPVSYGNTSYSYFFSGYKT